MMIEEGKRGGGGLGGSGARELYGALIKRWRGRIILDEGYAMIYLDYKQCCNETLNELRRTTILFTFVCGFLYETDLAPVPQFSFLPPIAKAPMVKPILPQEVNSPAQPLFRTLIPYTVRQSIALYNERKTTLINKQLIPEWEAITSQEHALLRELGLPGSLQAVEVSLGLPPSLVTHMDDVKTKGRYRKIKTNACRRSKFMCK